MDVVGLLRELCQACGVSGYEAPVRAIVQRALEPHADEIRQDALGNLVALKRGQRQAAGRVPSVMLAAHLDEIGLMVTGIERGFLRFTPVGGVDTRTIVGQEVTVHGRRPLPGIIASRPPHVVPQEERDKPVPLDKLFIDVGLDATAIEQTVCIGDIVTLRGAFQELADGCVAGKAFDDRTGVVSLALCLEMLTNMAHSWDVFVVATSQEERGLRGATVAAYGINPDVAIAVDVTFAMQPGTKESETVALDGGPAIGFGPNIHPLVFERLRDAARSYEIKHQIEVLPGNSGTDAWAIQVTREGIPTGLVSIPLRYMHTSVELACIRDIERSARLLALFVTGLDASLEQALGSQRRG